MSVHALLVRTYGVEVPAVTRYYYCIIYNTLDQHGSVISPLSPSDDDVAGESVATVEVGNYGQPETNEK